MACTDYSLILGFTVKNLTFPAPTQVWHASAGCDGRSLPKLKDFPEFLEGFEYDFLESIDGPAASVCLVCALCPSAPIICCPFLVPLFDPALAAITVPRPPSTLNRALLPSSLVARASPLNPAAFAVSAPSPAPILPLTVATTVTVSAPPVAPGLPAIVAANTSARLSQ